MEFARARLLRDAVGFEQAWILFQGRHVVADRRHTFRRYAPVRDLDLGIRLFRHEGALPAALGTTRWSEASSPENAAQQVRERHVVEGEAASADVPANEVTGILGRPAPDRLVLSLPPHPGPLLVRLSESYFPGWTGRTASGAPLAIHPVDAAFLGFVVPAGEERVELQFRPQWLSALLGLSSAALIITLILSLPLRRREPSR
jgi:hypothetical protein